MPERTEFPQAAAFAAGSGRAAVADEDSHSIKGSNH